MTCMRKWATIAYSVLFLVLFIIPSSISTSHEGHKGKELYRAYCALCHHPDRLGLTASPLLSQLLRNFSDEDLFSIIKHGLSATQMPSFGDLHDEEIKAIVSFLRTPTEVKWSKEDIKNSLEISNKDTAPLKIKDIKNLTIVVERGNNKVWVMEADSILDKFDYSNIHGGLKFTPDGKIFFIPARDGWAGMYDTDKGRLFAKIRPCVNLRNISLSRDGKSLFASCLLPESIVIIDVAALKNGQASLKYLPLKGKINALYELHSRDEAVFTFRDKPLLGIMNTKNFHVRYIKLKKPFDDFFIEPMDNYVIGSSRNGKCLQVYSMKEGKKVFEHPIDSMPHLFSSAFWYDRGTIYFATTHIGKPYLTVWKMYDWGFVRKVDVGGSGFFVRTNSNNPYLWVDNGTDELVLIDKRELSKKKIVPIKGKKVIHTELSGDGKIAYISIYENDGNLILYDASTLEELSRFPAKLPVGKYNFVNKHRKFDAVQLGQEVFNAKCWGCHHSTHEAFAPSLKWIAENRDEGIIRTHISYPQDTYKSLGYNKTSMPKIHLSNEEMEFLISFIKETAHAKDN